MEDLEYDLATLREEAEHDFVIKLVDIITELFVEVIRLRGMIDPQYQEECDVEL